MRSARIPGIEKLSTRQRRCRLVSKRPLNPPGAWSTAIYDAKKEPLFDCPTAVHDPRLRGRPGGRQVVIIFKNHSQAQFAVYNPDNRVAIQNERPAIFISSYETTTRALGCSCSCFRKAGRIFFAGRE